MAQGSNQLEKEFHEQMLGICRREKEIGRNPTVFEDILKKLGGLQTAKRLLQRRDSAHTGFRALQQRRRAQWKGGPHHEYSTHVLVQGGHSDC